MYLKTVSLCPLFCIPIFFRQKTVEFLHRTFALFLVDVAVPKKHRIGFVTGKLHDDHLIDARLCHIRIKRMPQVVEPIWRNLRF